MKTLLIASLFIAVCISTFVLLDQNPADTGQLRFTTKARIANVELNLAKATTSESRERGLSGQKELGQSEGLLFEFEEAGSFGIWMKDMLFAIDVLWLDENYSVIALKENFLPSSYPEVAYGASPALFVLELPAGFIATHKINIGDKLSF